MPENHSRAESAAFAEFVSSGSEAAFALVVKDCLPLVLGTALRITGGQRSLAEDVSQVVFADLAKKSAQVRAETLLAWLYKHTCFTASKAMRSERRRIQREKSAAAQSQPTETIFAPPIDELLADLDRKDREALFLRYVEGRSHQEVGDALGISKSAAQKRSERAIGRLRSTLGPSLSGAGLLAMLTAPAAEGATLVTSIASASVGASTGKIAWFAKPVSGAIWGAAAAVTLSSVPLSLAWKDYHRASESAHAEHSTRVLESNAEPAPAAKRATVEEFGSAAEMVSALLALTNQFGLGQASINRSLVVLKQLPPEWAHDVIVQLERDLPAGVRNSDWHREVLRSVAHKWEPRQVPEDLFAVWPIFNFHGMQSLFQACVQADLPAMREFLNGFQDETRLGHFHQPNSPHCALASLVIQQALKDCPEEVSSIFDRVPRIEWVGYEWLFPGEDEIQRASKDPALRAILEESIASMKDERRRRAFQKALYKNMGEVEFMRWLNTEVDPQRRAEAVTMKATMEETSLAWWEKEVPQSLQATLAGVLAENRFNDQEPVFAWMERIGERNGGEEFDRLRANVLASSSGKRDAEPVTLADLASRIVDPALRVGSLGELLKSHASKSEPLQAWMEQNLTEAELEEYRQITKRIRRR